MRITYLSSSVIPGPEANSVQVVRMCDNFARDHDVTLVCRIGGSLSEGALKARYGLSNDFRVVRFWWPDFPVFGSALYAIQVALFVLLHRKPDLFYGRHLISLVLVKYLGVPIVFEAHMPPASGVSRWLCERLFLSRSFARLVCVSRKLLSYYQRLFASIDDHNGLVAPNGADRFQQGSVSAGMDLPAPLIGYIGSAKKEKGIDLVLALAQRMPGYSFCIAGPSRSELEIKGFSVPSNVHCIGFLSQKEVLGLLVQLDVVLAPYKPGAESLKDDAQWGSPLKVFEFMAASKCIVASDIGIVRELLTDGVEGVLCAPSDIKAWQTAVESLLSDESRRGRLAGAAHSRFCDLYDRAVRAKRVLEGL